MIRTELFKLRTHRTPWVLFTIVVVAILIAPIYFAFKPPDDGQAVIDTFTLVFEAVTPLLGTIFGGWVIGHEFRHGTLRRVLGSDARRRRLIATKAAVGFGSFTVGMTLAAGIGALASAASVASFGGAIEFDGLTRDILGSEFMALVPAVIAFALSIILRSDTYSILGALALMIIVGPLLGLIPRVGKYSPPSLALDVSAWINGSGDLEVSIIPASLGLAAFLGALAAASLATFQRRDI